MTDWHTYQLVPSRGISETAEKGRIASCNEKESAAVTGTHTPRAKLPCCGSECPFLPHNRVLGPASAGPFLFGEPLPRGWSNQFRNGRLAIFSFLINRLSNRPRAISFRDAPPQDARPGPCLIIRRKNLPQVRPSADWLLAISARRNSSGSFRHLRLLRARRERPRHGATEQCDEIATPHGLTRGKLAVGAPRAARSRDGSRPHHRRRPAQVPICADRDEDAERTRGSARGAPVCAWKNGDGRLSPRSHQLNNIAERRARIASEGEGAVCGMGPVADRS